VTARSILLFVLLAGKLFAGPVSVRSYAPCIWHTELLKQSHMDLGVRIATTRPVLAKQFRLALNFWSHVLDMDWYDENSIGCALQLNDAPLGSFSSGNVAEAQDPAAPGFQGWIGFDPRASLTTSELYYYCVHEIGHLLGLDHNTNPQSVMYFEDAPGPELLDRKDLISLAAHHKLRTPLLSTPIYVRNSRWERARHAFRQNWGGSASAVRSVETVERNQ
jgi:Matrixin